MSTSLDKPESRYLRRLTALERERKPFEDEWGDVTTFLYPRRSGWNLKESDPDKSAYDEIYDGTAIEALNLMSDGLLGHLVPASIPFFRLRPSLARFNNYAPLRGWLDDCQLHILQALERSNFYAALGEAFPDAAALGTAVIFMEEDIATGRIFFSVRHLKECFLAENRFGIVDTVYRKFEMTLEQLEDQFASALDEKMLERAKKEPDEHVTVLHVVEPGRGSRKWDSRYILVNDATKNDGHVLDEGGFDFFPYLVWRFRKTSDEVYGRGAGMDALADTIMQNHQAKTMADAAQRAVDPPLLAHESMKGKIKLNPHAISYWDQYVPGGKPVQELYGARGNYPIGIDQMERRAQNIRRHFRSDFFSYLLGSEAGKDRTATEINAIEAQKAAVLGSTIGRINKDLFEPAIHNVWAIELAARRLPATPQEVVPLLGMPLEIEYTGPLAQKQRQYLRSQGVIEGANIALGLAERGVTGPIDIYDWDWIAKEGSEANGMPEKGFLDPKIVQKNREIRAQQAAQMQAAQLQLEAAKVNPALAKAPEPGSPAEKAQKAEAVAG